MTTGALVSVGDYLKTSYEPDCDYVDGVIVERNVACGSLKEAGDGILRTAQPDIQLNLRELFAYLDE